uniref:Uncharacterized protein n=1 Tax=Oryza nivara TaxID=4536 RepID=A0A0E0IRC6_ORYNI
MEFDDEFNEFVMNELIDPSSSDEEHDLFFGAAQMIIEESNYKKIKNKETHTQLQADLIEHLMEDLEQNGTQDLLIGDLLTDEQTLCLPTIDACWRNHLMAHRSNTRLIQVPFRAMSILIQVPSRR